MRRHTRLAAILSLAALSTLFSLPGTASANERGDRLGPPRAGVRAPHVAHGQWWDGAHGHGHAYPVSGWRVHTLPPRAHFVVWGGVRYGYFDGIWYAPYGSAFVVARPPVGVYVTDLPSFRTVVTIGGMTYLYANGVYYRERPDNTYEVVPSPIVGAGDGASARAYVYPKMNQSAEKQASDEYECHRWAVSQTGFDPSAQATGQAVSTVPRGDYARAQSACLEGRGYTVR